MPFSAVCLTGRMAIVTGAAEGLGSSFVAVFRDAGLQLVGSVLAPREVANLALFLASDAVSYSTSSEFVCHGGMRA